MSILWRVRAHACTHNDFCLTTHTHPFDWFFCFTHIENRNNNQSSPHILGPHNCHHDVHTDCESIFSQINEIKMIELYSNIQTNTNTNTWSDAWFRMHIIQLRQIICLKIVEITKQNDIPLYSMSVCHAIRYISTRCNQFACEFVLKCLVSMLPANHSSNFKWIELPNAECWLCSFDFPFFESSFRMHMLCFLILVVHSYCHFVNPFDSCCCFFGSAYLGLIHFYVPST